MAVLMTIYLGFAAWALTGLGSLEAGDNYGGVFEQNSGPEVFTQATYVYGNRDSLNLYTKAADYPTLQLEWMELNHLVASMPNFVYSEQMIKGLIFEMVSYGAAQGSSGVPTNCTLHSDTTDASWPAEISATKFLEMQSNYVDAAGVAVAVGKRVISGARERA